MRPKIWVFGFWNDARHYRKFLNIFIKYGQTYLENVKKTMFNLWPVFSPFLCWFNQLELGQSITTSYRHLCNIHYTETPLFRVGKFGRKFDSEKSRKWDIFHSLNGRRFFFFERTTTPQLYSSMRLYYLIGGNFYSFES